MLGIVLGLYLWFHSYSALLKVRQIRPNPTHRLLSVVLHFLCVAFLVVVLLTRSSSDVRSSAGWIVLYTLGGAAWLQLGLFLLSFLGVAARDDVLERQNPAAAWVVYGAMIGITLCYAGSNIGNGPGPEVVLFCAVLSTTFLFALWLLLERLFRLADCITIERDESVGIRAGGWLLSLGLIFGGAVTGDWVSMEGTIRDFFRYAWVALLLLLVAVVIELSFHSSLMREKAHRRASVVIAFVYFLAAAVYVVWRGAD